ncbi:flagellar filament capping protein FliD [Thermodesulfobacterium sp.]|jgi:flagellar hook-associated protein 2|uniref:flagellar filament capping protein FliD n=1 Tax=Thermodesulfobacterium sp. TaxID=1965289 RepID=UPI002647DF24|nr:flagellar filament capping protein FliD [Thermodesulfobacterium sp.]MDK2861240.1 flagellar hook-associated protein 2 [Thermodesulfobacterium sp.]MDN5379567.1 flagellar hook-associated protein 2 [Thermodesulfobacterium sp.]
MADTPLYLNNVTGLLDVDSMVQGILQPKLKTLNKLQQDKATLQIKNTAIANLLGAIKSAQSSIDSLNVENLFKNKSVVVDDSSILSASATKDTPNVSLNLTVLQLSQTETRISTQGVESLSSSIEATTFNLKYYTSNTDYQTFTINFGGGNLQNLVDTINQSQDKVTASVFYDGTSYKLMLAEKSPEASTKETQDQDTVIQIEGNFPAVLGGLTTLQEAKNTKIQIGTNTIESPGATVNNLLPGLTVNVKKTGSTSITIKDDYSQVSSELSKVLDNLNSVLSLIKSNTDKGQLFQGNAMLTQVKTQFLNNFKPLIKLGIINVNDEGNFSINTSTLNSLLEKNPDQVKQAIYEFKNNFSKTLTNLNSAFNIFQNRQNLQIELIDKKISSLQEAIAKEESRLRLAFSKIEALLYRNDQLKAKLQSFATPLSESK